jgi:hypothetical protein
MQVQPQANCPLDGFNPCRQTGCGWFTRLAGTNPNTGAETEEWGCAMAWLPLLLIETASQSRQTGAAVESFRNAVLGAGPVSSGRPPADPNSPVSTTPLADQGSPHRLNGA